MGQKQNTENKRERKPPGPKYWGKQIFTHRSFPEVGQKQNTEKKERERKKERAKIGNKNGQLRIAT